MYYLSMLIDGRKYQQLKLKDSLLSDSDTDNKLSFLLQRGLGEDKMVFSINKATKLVYHGGFKGDCFIDWSQVSVVLEGECLTINFIAAQEDKQSSFVATNSIKEEGQRYCFYLPSDSRVTNLTTHIVVRKDAKEYRCFFNLHLVPQQQIYDLVMDFGSEASQILVHRRGSGATLTRTKTIDKLIEYYYPSFIDKILHQKDADPELYLSRFFIKKKGAFFFPDHQPGTHNEKELLNLITEKSVASINRLREETELVPNLKLAHLGAFDFGIGFESAASNSLGRSEIQFKEVVLFIQQAVVNYFIQIALEGIYREAEQNAAIYLAVRILVPNVFDQEKVAFMVNRTSESLVSFQRAGNKLKGFEVNTISESDASFLGYFKSQREVNRINNTLFNPGDYVIVDAGKGTTDISILHIDKGTKEFNSVFRSGFVGAGNTLSFSFIDSIFTSIFGNELEARQRGIMATSLSEATDLSEKMDFLEVIELCKKNYDSTKQDALKSLQELIPDELEDIKTELEQSPDGTGVLKKIVEAITAIISKQSTIKDEFGIINDTTDDIVNKLHEAIVTSGHFNPEQTQSIVLTGRAFLFKELVSKIQVKFKGLAVVLVDEKQLKYGCLNGDFYEYPINFDSNLVGIPKGYKLFDSSDNQSQPKTSIMDRLVSMMDRGNDFEERKDTSKEERFIIEGEKIDAFNPREQVVSISGLTYSAGIGCSGKVYLYYTGDSFILRSSNAVHPLSVNPDFFRKTQMVFQTLYPFVRVNNSSEIAIKRLNGNDYF